MLKSSVVYENLHSNSPPHDKQTLKIDEPFFHNNLSSYGRGRDDDDKPIFSETIIDKITI